MDHSVKFFDKPPGPATAPPGRRLMEARAAAC